MKLLSLTLAVTLAVLLPWLATGAEPDRGKALGNPAAPILIEMYSDFQCPHCKHLHETFLPGFIKDFVDTGKVYFICREFPLPSFGVRSREAAAYATAAARVGKYQQVADVLFRNQSSWAQSGKIWETVATVLTPTEQTKVQAFSKDPAVLAEVQRDVDAAMQAKIPSTPTFIITHRLQQRPWSFWDDNGALFRGYLNELLTK